MQRKFVHHLVHDKMNQTAAARLAGFNQPGTSANYLMRNPKVVAAIAEERAEYAKASGMTKQKVIEGFTESINLARIKADPIAMIAGWREIGKMCGFYEATKSEIKVSVQGQVMLQRLNSMSDEELLALAEGDPSVLEGEFTIVDDQQPGT
jgi:phage terminase small subunit